MHKDNNSIQIMRLNSPYRQAGIYHFLKAKEEKRLKKLKMNKLTGEKTNDAA